MAHDIKKKWRSDDVILKEDAYFTSVIRSERVLAGLERAGFRKPSPIQFEAIPIGRYGLDLIVQAKSGTGKTLVFTVIALEKLVSKVLRPQVLILAPTREIATQICSVIKVVGSTFPKLTCNSFIGGLSVQDDKEKAYTSQIVVGTPGRLRQLIQIGCLPTRSIRLLVLDEADQLFESSFKPAIEEIFTVLPKDKQVIATSATYPPKMKKLLLSYLGEPYVVSLSSEKLALLGIVHYAKVLQNSLVPFMTYKFKLEALEKILKKLRYSQCLVFCNSLAKVELLWRDIKKWGFSTTYISSAKDQVDRLKAMERLKEYKCKILVSSDVAARGIDAENVDLVVNFEVPMTTETYLHRAGRAGRYGSVGVTISLICDKEIKIVEQREMEGGFKTYILPDPLPSNLIRKPILGEPLIDDVKAVSSTSPDTEIGRDQVSNGFSGKGEADKALPCTTTVNGNTTPKNQSHEEYSSNNIENNVTEQSLNNSKEQYSSSDVEDGTLKQNLNNSDSGSSLYESNASPKLSSVSPKEKTLKRKLVHSIIINVPPEEYPTGNTAHVSLKVSSGNAKKSIEQQNIDDVEDILGNICDIGLKSVNPVRQLSIELDELISSNAGDATFEICDSTCTNSNNVAGHVQASEVDSNKAEEHGFELFFPSNFKLTEGNYDEGCFSSASGRGIPLDLTQLGKNGEPINTMSLVSPGDIFKAKSENSCTMSNIDEMFNKLPVLSPMDIANNMARRKHKEQTAAEISPEHGCKNDDNSVRIEFEEKLKDIMVDCIQENMPSVERVRAPEGHFESYEEYDLSFRIVSFLQGYEGNIQNAVSAFEEKFSLEHGEENGMFAEKMKDLISKKSEFYHKVFKTYLQEHTTPEDSADKKKTDSKNSKETSPKLLHGNVESNHMDETSNQVACNDEDVEKYLSAKFTGKPGRGVILFSRPGYEDSEFESDPDLAESKPVHAESDSVPALEPLIKAKSTPANLSSSSYNSDSSPSSKSGIVHMSKQNQRRDNDSSSDSESCSDADSDLPSQSKKINVDNLYKSDSSSDSEYSSSSSDSDSSACKKKIQSKKKGVKKFHESDSSSDSEYSSDSSDSDASSCRRNIHPKKRGLHKSKSSSDSESSSLSSDTDSSASYKNRRNNISNSRNPCNSFHIGQQSTPFTAFSSTARNSMRDNSKFLSSFTETPYQEYNYCRNIHMSRESSIGQSRVCTQCTKDQHAYSCMKKNCKPSHNLQKECLAGKCHKYAENSVCSVSDMTSDYNRIHCHNESCYRPTSHRCHPILPGFTCSNERCTQWYNTFYSQWMYIRRHANLPY